MEGAANEARGSPERGRVEWFYRVKLRALCTMEWAYWEPPGRMQHSKVPEFSLCDVMQSGSSGCTGRV